VSKQALDLQQETYKPIGIITPMGLFIGMGTTGFGPAVCLFRHLYALQSNAAQVTQEAHCSSALD